MLMSKKFTLELTKKTYNLMHPKRLVSNFLKTMSGYEANKSWLSLSQKMEMIIYKVTMAMIFMSLVKISAKIS